MKTGVQCNRPLQLQRTTTKVVPPVGTCRESIGTNSGAGRQAPPDIMPDLQRNNRNRREESYAKAKARQVHVAFIPHPLRPEGETTTLRKTQNRR